MSGMVAFQGLRARGAVHGVGQVRAVSLVERARSRAVAVQRGGVRCEEARSNGEMGGRNHSGMNLVFVAAEVGPWSKTGGLCDVLGGLPSALAARGHRVMTVSPRHDQYKVGWDTNTPIEITGVVEITIGNRTEAVNFYLTHNRGVDRIFVRSTPRSQAEVGLPIRPDVPLFGFIGRLEEQKGSDILAEAVKDLLKDDVQLIVLGTGKKHLEKQLELDSLFTGKAVGVVKFNTPLAHMITAGALVPSRCEPCGLIQLHAMRYETASGLVDTVKEGVTGFHVGKAFNVDCEKVDPEDVDLLSATVKRAVEAYGSALFRTMIKSCMDQDLSWKGPARRWEETLVRLQVEGSGPGQEGAEIAPKAMANVAAP